MSLEDIVVAQIQCDRSLKILKLFAERVDQPREAAAVHPRSMILFFNVRCANAIYVRHPGNNFFDFNHFAGLYRAAAGAGALPSGVTEWVFEIWP